MASLALTSDSNILEVNFHSDMSYTDKGFSAEYSAYDPADRELKVLSHAHTNMALRDVGEMLKCDDTLPLQRDTWTNCVVWDTTRQYWLTKIGLFNNGGLEIAAVKLKS